MTFDASWPSLPIKIGVTVLVIIAGAQLAERVGPFFAALVASLPLSAGPAYVLLAMQSHPPFIAHAALSSLSANAAMAVFLVTVVKFAPRFNFWISFGVAIAVWIALAALIEQFHWTALSALLLNLLVYAICFRFTPQTTAPERPPGVAAPRYDLPIRALLVGIFVAAVVTLSHAIGPAITGLALLFPINFTSVAFVIYPRLGGAVVSSMMSTALRAMIGMALALFVLCVTVERVGAPLSLTLSLAVCLLWSAGLTLVRHRNPLTAATG